MQRLIDKRRHYTAVVQRHARTVRIEDAGNICPEAVDAVVSHRKCFGVAFAFVVTRTQSYGIYISPIALRLWMLQRIAVTFRCRSDEEASLILHGNFQKIARAGRTGFQGFDRMRQIIYWTGERGEVENTIDCLRKL
jgi:hypothetical protein